MARQTVMTILGLVLASVCAARPARAQTQATTTDGTQQSDNQEQSAAALAQEATNPFSSGWLMQMQQNNNWTELPLDGGRRMQSNLMFQPLVSFRLTDAWGLYLRPVVTIFNSQPHLDEHGGHDRNTGFGDTVLGAAVARPLFGGRLVVGGGPTFIFPTASQRQLGQDTWQAGPDLGVTLLGKSFIAYAFAQQWFKVGGDGRNTNQMNTVFNVSEMLARREHGDEHVDKLVNDFAEMARNDPTLWEKVRGQRDPFGWAHREMERQRLLRDVGDDPSAYEKKLREKWEAERTAQMPAGLAVPTNTPAPNMPQSLAGVRSVAGRTAPVWSGPPSDQQIAADIRAHRMASRQR
jgi:hypothetical protein